MVLQAKDHSDLNRTNAPAWRNIPHPLGLTHPDHVAPYNCLNERIVVVTKYYDKDLLAKLGILDDIIWLFTRGSIGHFLEVKQYTDSGLTIEFLSALHVEVTRVP